MRFYGLNIICIVLLCLAVHISAQDECNKKSRLLIDERVVMTNPLRDLSEEFRPWRIPTSLRNIESSITKEGHKFQLNVDVMHFSPSDISVKVVDGHVIMSAKHDEKKDELGFVSRQLVRRYPLPEGVKSEEVMSQLSTDGILTVGAPNTVTDKGRKDRLVKIMITGPKRNEAKEKDEDGNEEKSCENENCDDYYFEDV